VTFLDGGTMIGTGTLNGSTPNQATFSTTLLTGGTHSITARYNGDSIYAMSTSAAVDQVVSKATVNVSLTSSLNPSHFGESVTFTATVDNMSASGSVTFFDGLISLGSGNLSGGATNTATFSTSTLTAGSHEITATYNGDVNFNTATSNTVSQQVDTAVTTTVVTSAPNPSTYGQSVTITATVNQAGATGTVTFFDGAATLGTGTLNGLTPNQATFTTTTLPAASHSLTATYGGDGVSAIVGSTIPRECFNAPYTYIGLR